MSKILKVYNAATSQWEEVGVAGKSAYQYAIESGYTGTPTQFSTDLKDVGNKVDKIDGKVLSTNDFTNEYKNILDAHPTDQDNPHNTSISNLSGFPQIATNNRFLRDDRSFSEIIAGSGGYASNIYFTTLNSDIATYKKISYSLETLETELTISATNQSILINTYLYDSAVGVTNLDEGSWDFYVTCKLNAVSGGNKIKAIVFKRNTSNIETDLITVYSSEITNTSYAQLRFQLIQPNISVLSTDRIGVKLYFETTNTNPVVFNMIVGDGQASYFTTPLALRHSQLRLPNEDLNVLHLTAAQVVKVDNAVQAESSLDTSGKIITEARKTNHSGVNTDLSTLNLVALNLDSNITEVNEKINKTGTGQVLPAGIATAYDILQKIGIEANADLTTLLANTSNALFNALAGASKDTLVEIIKWLIEKKLDRTLTKDSVWVGGESGEAVEEAMIEYIDPNLTNPTQIDPKGFCVRLNTGAGVVYLHNIFRSIVLPIQTQAINQIYASNIGRKLLIKDIYLLVVTRNSGTTPINNVNISLSINRDGTMPFSTVAFPPSTSINNVVAMSVPSYIVTLDNGIFYKTDGYTDYTLQLGLVVIINALYL